MPSGYIYCFSNKAMPGIYKIGATERDPQERLKSIKSLTYVKFHKKHIGNYYTIEKRETYE
jgi:hypothetical protein